MRSAGRLLEGLVPPWRLGRISLPVSLEFYIDVLEGKVLCIAEHRAAADVPSLIVPFS